MPRKQRFKPTRKPKLTSEPVERIPEPPPIHPITEETALSQRSEEQENERRSE